MHSALRCALHLWVSAERLAEQRPAAALALFIS